MPKIVDKDAMRARIMEAAMGCFATKGFHAAKMTDIAKAAGLAKGTLYLYFKSKDQLTTSLVKWIFQDVEQKMIPQGTVATLDEYIGQLRWTLDAPEEAQGETRMFFEVLGPSFGSMEVVQEIEAFFERVSAQNAAQLKVLVSAGEVRAGLEPDVTARMITSVIDGMVTHRALFGIDDKRYNAMLEKALEFIRRGLEP